MRRFELAGENGTRFWELELVGTELTLRSGKVGSRALPEEREESYRNAAEAKREAERLVRSRLAAGWTELVEKAAAEDVEALLARGDEAQWLVFADQLIARGDVRGELITLEQSLGKKRTARARLAAFVEEHDQALLGSLAEYRDQLKAEWRFGYLHSVSVGCEPESPWAPTRDEEQIAVEDLLPALLALESSRFLRVLKIGWPEDTADCSYDSVLDVLAKEAWPRYLETLVLGDFTPSSAESRVPRLAGEDDAERDLWPHVRNLKPLAAKLATLRHLTVRANLRRFGVRLLPKLESLELHVQHLEDPVLDDVLFLEAPLISFVVDLPHSVAVRAGSFQRVLQGQAYPRLRAFGLGGVGEEVLRLVERAPILPQLERLDLSGNGLDDSHVREFVARQKQFAHLEKLLLRGNSFSKEGGRELKAVLPNVDLAHQRG
jgi:predicted DNA-binding WGR domain protein